MSFFDAEKDRAAGLILVLGVALAVALWPFTSGLIGALVLYVIFVPVYRWLTEYIPDGPASALVIVLGILVIVGPVASIISLLATQGPDMVQGLLNSPLIDRLRALRIGRFDVGAELSRQIQTLGTTIVPKLGNTALGLLGSATRLALSLTIAFFGFYYMLRAPGNTWSYMRPFIPFSAENAQALKKRFKDVTISTLIGTFLTAAVQGGLLGLAFWASGLANPVFWSVVTALFAILPVVGSGLIWIPAAGVLFLQEKYVWAIAMIAWGFVVVGGVDNLIRPWVYRRYARIHPFITVIGAFAGIRYFGLLGLLIGPLAISYFFELIRMYREEYLAHIIPPPEEQPRERRRRFSLTGMRKVDPAPEPPPPSPEDVS
jgi:predicted PurR-regulated permease PerM